MTVTVVLPTARAAAEEPTESESGGAESPAVMEAGHGRILFVEDDPRLRAAAERALRRLGYEVTSAENGRVALERIQTAPDTWDLVVSDLVMPELGGLELFEEVQLRGWRMPFLFMSGHGPEAVSSAEGMTGTFTFLEKPWTLARLAATVRDALEDAASPA